MAPTRELALASSFMDIAARNAQLRAFYCFTDEDREANQHGVLSFDQRHSFEGDMQMVQRMAPGFLSLVIILFGGMFVYVLVPAEKWFSPPDVWAAIWPLLLVTGISCLPFFYYVHVLHKGRVRKISGKATIQPYTNALGDSLKSYYVRIGKKKFMLSSKNGNFVSGTNYTVYYINKFGILTVLSAQAES